MYSPARAIAGALACCALVASCAQGQAQSPRTKSAMPMAATFAPFRAAPPPAAPAPPPLEPDAAGQILLPREDLARVLGRAVVGDKSASVPFPDQQVAPQTCMTAVDIGFKRQLGDRLDSFAYFYTRTPKEEGNVWVVAEDVAVYPTQKAAAGVLEALNNDLGQCSGTQAVQHSSLTQAWQVAVAMQQAGRAVWSTAQTGSHDWHCDYQAQTRSNAFLSVMFCQRGDGGGMADTLMRTLAARVG